jgi:5'-3' exonuclease
MGIKGLFQFLKRFETEVSISATVTSRSVGVDLFWFLHYCKGDINTLQQHLLPLLTHASEVHCVIDGTPSLKRKEELQEKDKKRQEILHTIQEIRTHTENSIMEPADRLRLEMHLSQLTRQAWKPGFHFIMEVITWLESKGCTIHRAEDEADDLLIQMEQEGQIDMIVTHDSDLLTMGSRSLLRVYDSDRGGWFVRDQLCAKVGCTQEQWNHFMYLCRHRKEPDLLLAYSLIRVYHNADEILERYDLLHAN